MSKKCPPSIKLLFWQMSLICPIRLTLTEDWVSKRGELCFIDLIFLKPVSTSASLTSKPAVGGTSSEKAYFYCKKLGHLIADYPVLCRTKKSSKPVVLTKLRRFCCNPSYGASNSREC